MKWIVEMTDVLVFTALRLNLHSSGKRGYSASNSANCAELPFNDSQQHLADRHKLSAVSAVEPSI
jgi:hypothetical protein